MTILGLPRTFARRSMLPALTAGAAALALAFTAAAAQEGERISLTDAGFAGPESVFYDADSDRYLVSNVNGSPAQADGNGFISILTPEGEVAELRWVDGEAEGVELDAPKGMAVANGVLYVADITNVRMFDLASGDQVGSIEVEGTSFLNDVAAHPDGGVLVTDTGVDANFQPTGNAAVYRVMEDGSVERAAQLADHGMPNGIIGLGDGTFAIVTLDTPGRVLYFDGESVTESIEFEAGGFDGVIGETEGSLLVSSWSESAVLRLDREGNATTVAEGFESPADIGYDDSRGRVLIPLLNGDAVHIVPVMQE